MHNVSLPTCSVCIKLAKAFVDSGFSKKFKFGKVWKYIISFWNFKRECSLAGERPSISINWGNPVLPQDPGCMYPPPCLGDAGPSAHLAVLCPDRELTWLEWIFPLGCTGFQQEHVCWFPAGCFRCAAPTGGGWEERPPLTAACWLGDSIEASDQITHRIMASERTLLWGSRMHWGWNMSKEETRGIIASFPIETIVKLSVPVLNHIAEVLCTDYLIILLPFWGSSCHTLASGWATITPPALHYLSHWAQEEWGMLRVTTLPQLSSAIYRLFPGSCLEHQRHTTSSGTKNVSKCKNDTFKIQFTGTNF